MSKCPECNTPRTNFGNMGIKYRAPTNVPSNMRVCTTCNSVYAQEIKRTKGLADSSQFNYIDPISTTNYNDILPSSVHMQPSVETQSVVTKPIVTQSVVNPDEAIVPILSNVKTPQPPRATKINADQRKVLLEEYQKMFPADFYSDRITIQLKPTDYDTLKSISILSDLNTGQFQRQLRNFKKGKTPSPLIACSDSQRANALKTRYTKLASVLVEIDDDSISNGDDDQFQPEELDIMETSPSTMLNFSSSNSEIFYKNGFMSVFSMCYIGALAALSNATVMNTDNPFSDLLVPIVSLVPFGGHQVSAIIDNLFRLNESICNRERYMHLKKMAPSVSRFDKIIECIANSLIREKAHNRRVGDEELDGSAGKFMSRVNKIAGSLRKIANAASKRLLRFNGIIPASSSNQYEILGSRDATYLLWYYIYSGEMAAHLLEIGSSEDSQVSDYLVENLKNNEMKTIPFDDSPKGCGCAIS